MCSGEKHAFRAGVYNVILAGAAFMHTDALQAFWAPELAPLRADVDEAMNGEDLLLNYAVAAATNASRPCIQVSHLELRCLPEGDVLCLRSWCP